jgi:hypothetical protein
LIFDIVTSSAGLAPSLSLFRQREREP